VTTLAGLNGHGEHGDVAAEQAALGAMMQNSGATAEVAEILTADHYYRPAHQTIHKTIVGMRERGEPVDMHTLKARLEADGTITAVGGAIYLHTLQEAVTTVAAAGYHAQIVRDLADRRKLISFSTSLGQQAANHGISVADVQEAFRRMADAVAPGAGRTTPSLADRILPGGSILDVPRTPEAVWGDGDDIFWALGQALIIAGPDGVGKTTLAGNLIRARLGAGAGDVLGLPVKPGGRNVLVLLMDRPQQAMTALARLFTDTDRDLLDAHLRVWRGPPPEDLARNTGLLSQLCALADADTCIVDSLKDAVVKLTDDEAGSGWNRARQLAIEAGTELVELHHPRKRQDGNAKPATIDDLYGSRWIPAGAGSIISLWGQAGDPIIDLSHLKPVTATVGPWQMTINGETGEVGVDRGVDLLAQIRLRGANGMTAAVAARLITSSEKPTPNELARARRWLNKKVDSGFLVRRDGTWGGGPNRVETTWFLAA
jgi:replicative DNA helicase